MKSKTWLLGVVLASAVVGAQAADVDGSFASSASTSLTGFDSDAGLLKLSITSAFTGKAGYDITSVLLDGSPLTDLLPGLSDLYDFEGPIAAGWHTILVNGKSYGGGFNGAYEVSSVPEPASLALVLAGIGVVAGLSRRRMR